MLILDKQKAVERVMALTSDVTEAMPADGPREASAARARAPTSGLRRSSGAYMLRRRCGAASSAGAGECG